MTMRDMLDTWLSCVSGTLCRFPCNECRKIIGTENCPMEIHMEQEDLKGFISRVTATIKNYPDKDINITEEEFVNILMDSM